MKEKDVHQQEHIYTWNGRQRPIQLTHRKETFQSHDVTIGNGEANLRYSESPPELMREAKWCDAVLDGKTAKLPGTATMVQAEVINCGEYGHTQVLVVSHV